VSWAETTSALERLFSNFHRVWVYRIYDTVTDPDGRVRGWLEEHGKLFEDQVFTGESQLRVQGYGTSRDPMAGMERSLEVALSDGSLRLVAATEWPAEVEAGGALDLALVWQVDTPLSPGAILFAGLFDQPELGQTRWVQADERPLGSLYPPESWPVGTEIRTPVRLLVSASTPPGRYDLNVGWYRFVDGQPVWLAWKSGELLTLGQVEIVASKAGLPADGRAGMNREILSQQNAALLPAGVTMGGGVELLGFDAPVLEGQPGDSLELDLFWRSLDPSLAPGLAVLQLTDDAGNVLTEVASAPVGGRIPFSSLEAGQVIRDPRMIVLPGDLTPGVYNLILGRRRADGGWWPVQRGPVRLGSTYPLVTIRALDRPVDMDPPSVDNQVKARFGEEIRLLGYDAQAQLPDLPPAPQRLQLTLHWQALAPTDTPHKIFLHLIGPEGSSGIATQADVYPSVPTRAWRPGEYLEEHILLDLPDGLPPGRYTLLLGLYDEASGRRLPAFDAAGQPLGDGVALAEIVLGK
jgi:hypothetical protein